MNKVFVDLRISLDGFIAGPSGGLKNPLGDGGIDIHNWMFNQKSFRNHLGMEGGETNNTNNDIIENISKEKFSLVIADVVNSLLVALLSYKVIN